MTAEPSIRRCLVGAALHRFRGIRPKELRELLTEYGVPADEQTTLVALASRYGQRGWWDQYAGVLPETLTDYLSLEAAAAEVMIYDPQLVPDLLQTRQYARAITAARPGYGPGSQLDQAVAALAARQEAVLGGQVPLSVVIGEAVLRQQAGGPEVMAGQLARLAELASGSPGLTVQVLPFSAGAHPGAATGPHVILRFPHTPGLGLVCHQPLSSGFYLTGGADVTRYLRTFALLQAAALTVADSTRLIRESAGELRPPWE